MLQCPICLHWVEKFKSGSHVIPRWAMKMTKEGEGSYASLDLKQADHPKAIREQSDLICDLWCESCENLFRDDDANGARFFKNKAYIMQDILLDPKFDYIGAEIHEGSALCDLRSFIVSLLIRFEVFSQSIQEKSSLGSRFSFYAKAYLDRILDAQNASLLMLRNSLLGASHSNSVRTRFESRNCVRMVFCGYDIFMVSDGQGPADNGLSNLISDREIVIPVYGGNSLPNFNKLLQKIQQAGPLKRKRQG